ALDAADRPHVHVDPRVERHHAAGVDVEPLAGLEVVLDHGAAGMHEHPAIALELLHDEALATEQAGEDLALEVDADLHAARAGQEAVLLADQAAAVVGQLHRHHRAGVGRGERDLALARSFVGEHRGEQALAGDHALAGRHQLVHEAAALARAAAVAEHRVHPHRGVLVHQRAGLGDGALAGVKLDLDELHVGADDAEIDLVVAAPAGAGRRHWRHAGRAAGAARRLEFGDVADRAPVGETFAPAVILGMLLGVGARGVVVERADARAVAAGTEIPTFHANSLSMSG